MKKIIAAFDGLKLSDATMTYAIQIALKSKALLSGVFLDDSLYHGHNIYDTLDGQGILYEEGLKLNKEDKLTRQRSAEVFEIKCKKANIQYDIHHDKSSAIQELLRESIYGDLLLINSSETFNNFYDPAPTPFVKRILAETQCPVMLIPGHYEPMKKVILLYDGKPSSVFAIKMFNYLLPQMGNIPTEILSVVDENNQLSNDDLIREFIKCHYPSATYTLLHGNPEDECLQYLRQEKQTTLIVLGAYRRSTVSMWFKNSMADVLMAKLNLPTFIAHNK